MKNTSRIAKEILAETDINKTVSEIFKWEIAKPISILIESAMRQTTKKFIN